jgi:hypothetical protein
LYLPHLRDSPAWFGDETGTLLIGRELVRGQSAVGPIWLTFWHPYFPYQPGYAWLAGLFAFITSGDILGARFLNALIALTIATLICFWGRQRFGVIPAWFGALVSRNFCTDFGPSCQIEAMMGEDGDSLRPIVRIIARYSSAARGRGCALPGGGYE